MGQNHLQVALRAKTSPNLSQKTCDFLATDKYRKRIDKILSSNKEMFLVASETYNNGLI